MSSLWEPKFQTHCLCGDATRSSLLKKVQIPLSTKRNLVFFSSLTTFTRAHMRTQKQLLIIHYFVKKWKRILMEIIPYNAIFNLQPRGVKVYPKNLGCCRYDARVRSLHGCNGTLSINDAVQYEMVAKSACCQVIK